MPLISLKGCYTDLSASKMASTMKQWIVQNKENDFDGLVFQQSAPIPKVGDNEVLVKLEAASLNYRDLTIPKVCNSPV
jgi:NADPH:quinone reductase-like Zn-dependent oxidoreductase